MTVTRTSTSSEGSEVGSEELFHQQVPLHITLTLLLHRYYNMLIMILAHVRDQMCVAWVTKHKNFNKTLGKYWGVCFCGDRLSYLFLDVLMCIRC